MRGGGPLPRRGGGVVRVRADGALLPAGGFLLAGVAAGCGGPLRRDGAGGRMKSVAVR